MSKQRIIVMTLLGLMGIFPFMAFSQSPDFEASAPGVVKVGEQFAVTFSVNANPSDFTPPAFDDLQVISGPNQSRSSSMQYVNGKMTRSFNVRFSYAVRARQEGMVKIPPATVSVDGNTYKSNALEIEVIAGDATQSSGASRGGTSAGQNRQQAPKDDLFIRVLVNRRSVYVGQPLVATVKIYNQLNLSGFENFQPPAFDGFIKNDIEVPQLTSLERENVGGEIYGTGVLQQYLLIPQQSGELEIGKVELTCRIREEVARSFFGSFRERRVSVVSKPVKIEVKPLPGNKPATFSGGVGTFDVSATINKREVAVNDALDFKLTVSGRGNLRYISVPDIDFPSDFEVYDPDIKNAFRSSANGQAGKKIYEYLIIPRHAGNFVIPAIPLTFFDPEQERYITKTTAPIEIHVTGASGKTGSGQVITGFESQDLRYLGEDVRFIQTTGPEKVTKSLFFLVDSWLYWLAFVLSLVVLLVYLAVRKKKHVEASNVILTRNKKANKQVRRRLKKVRKHMKTREEALFYEEISRALWGYMSDRLMIPLSDLSREKVEHELKQRGIDEAAILRFFGVLDTCEYARYAPEKEKVRADMDPLYQQVVEVISWYEHKI